MVMRPAKKFSLNAGAEVVMNCDVQNNNAQFFILPNLTISLPIVNDIMIFNAGVRSSFLQNSYAQFSKENPFVAPQIDVKTTYIPIEAFLGLQGKITQILDYTTEVSYRSVEQLALFLNISSQNLNSPYLLSNSCGVTYADAQVFKLFGDLHFELGKNISLGGAFNYQQYQVQNDSKAWNLPNLVLESYVHYKSRPFEIQSTLNWVSNRSDLFFNNEVDIEGYVDVNASGAYYFSRQLKAHLNLYNLLNNKYNRYLHYQVQGIQALAGLTYQF